MKNAVAVESVVTVALCTGRHTYVGIVADYARALCSAPLNQNHRKGRGLRLDSQPERLGGSYCSCSPGV